MKHWLPTGSTYRRHFLMGVAVGSALRVFAYGVLVGLLFSPVSRPIHGLSPFLARLVPTMYWAATVSSFVWIPAAVGFVGAYFWQHLEVKDYVKAIWVNTIAFWLLSCVAITAWLSAVAPTVYSKIIPGGVFVAFIFFCLDVGMCSRGTKHGSKFWNSRLARQFLGDFSAGDEDEAI